MRPTPPCPRAYRRHRRGAARRGTGRVRGTAHHPTADDDDGLTRIADHIVFMEQGRLTEQGTYDDLVHAGGTFADLLRLSQER
ncbi:hypothetical protein GCM10023335_20550 [Streptomyces siamensis]|uniref:ABC transporter ATP-binding protein n=1 Tax=Streptomyces siamensis TaxID=1274986 RepID=A0ABP9INP5_9ACTN